MGTSCSIQHFKTKSDYGILWKPFVKPKALFHEKMGNDAQKSNFDKLPKIVVSALFRIVLRVLPNRQTFIHNK